MCWSGEASAVLATSGLATTAYLAVKGEKKELYLALGYFSLMELLQAITYTVINECENPLNQIYTLLGYLHIVFQPFFVNMVSQHFIPQDVAKKIGPFVYTLCFISSILMLVKLYPFTWAGSCSVATEPMCGTTLCSLAGNWHMAWDLPLNDMPMTIVIYCLACFLLPLIYGSWRVTIGHVFSGPAIAILLNTQKNEWPAVWCLLSIGLILMVIKTPLRKRLYVKSWPLWNLFKIS